MVKTICKPYETRMLHLKNVGNKDDGVVNKYFPCQHED